MIARYASLADLVSSAAIHADPKYSEGESWDGGLGTSAAIERVTRGDDAMAASIAPELDALVYDQGTGGARFIPSIAGSRVSIPAYLAGNPECMRRRTKRQDARTCRIYVSCVGNAAVDAASMRARGTTILGLLQALQAIGVIVDLTLVAEVSSTTIAKEPFRKRTDWDHTYDGALTILAPLECRPLDLSTAGFAIAHPGFFRSIVFPLARAIAGFQGAWSPLLMSSQNDLARYAREQRRVLGLLPSDVYIPRVVATSTQDPIFRDPQAWIAQHVNQALTKEVSL